MSELAKMLNQLSVESGAVAPESDEDHSYLGAEEITVVTDETATELEEAIADTAEKVEKMQASDVAAEKVAEAVDSLESNLAQLRAMAAGGQPLDNSGMRWYIQNVALSVEARELPSSLVRDEVMAMQHSFESAQVEDYTTEAEEKTEGVLSRLWKVLVQAFNSARTSIKQFFGTMGRSADAIVTGGQQLQRLASKTKGEAKKTELKTTGYGRLGGNPGQAIDKALQVFDGEFTSKVVEPMKKVLQPVVAALKGDVGANDLTDANWQAKFASMGLRDTSIELPGGVKAELKLNGDKITFNVTKPSPGAEKTAPLSPSEVSALGGKLVTLGRRMKLAEAKAEKYLDDAEKVMKAAQAAANKTEGDDAKAKRQGVAKVVTTAARIIKAGEGVVPTYVNYLSQLGKDAYNFGKASLGAHGAKAKEEPAAADDKGAAGN
jgi:hypothetical protein